MSEKNYSIKSLKICNKDISDYSIVLAQNAVSAERFAAEELQQHILEAVGVELPITENAKHSIYIGTATKKDVSKIKFDGFVIETDDSSLYLYGAIPRGTIYAVYSFLEKYIGYRKYEPGVERILKRDGIEIPCNLFDMQNPVFEYRVTDWISHTSDPKFAVWEKLNSSRAGLTEELGGAIKIAGGCHTFQRLCDPKIYFDEHPEYYSLINGVRIPAGNTFEKEYGQLCLTNPDVLKIVTENVKKLIAENPDCTIFDVSQNDNFNNCQCENCAAIDAEEGSPSGTLLRFINAIADEVKKDYPDVLIQTFAYQYTRKAPKITKPRDNVVIRLCSITACFRHPLSDKSCEQNVREFSTDLENWRKICDKISIWDYTTNYNCYFAPFPNFEVLRENVRYFADNKVIHVFEEDTPRTYTGDLGSLKAYVLARLLWNPYMTEEEYEAHICDFLEGYFGPGWRNIRKYMDILHETTKDKHISCFELIDIMYSEDYEERISFVPHAYQKLKEEHYLTDFITRIDEVKALWDKAFKMAKTEEERVRILRSRMSIDYLDLFCRPYNRETMSESERREYEAAVELFHQRKKRFGQHTNIHTAIKKH